MSVLFCFSRGGLYSSLFRSVALCSALVATRWVLAGVLCVIGKIMLPPFSPLLVSLCGLYKLIKTLFQPLFRGVGRVFWFALGCWFWFVFKEKTYPWYIKNAKADQNNDLLLWECSSPICDCVACLFFFHIVNHSQSLSKCTCRTEMSGTSCYECSLSQ